MPVQTWDISLGAGTFAAAEAISGIRAVVLTAQETVVVAQPNSGLRMPAMGVAINDVISGEMTAVIFRGRFLLTPGTNPVTWSGQVGLPCYVGSGGVIVPAAEVQSGMARQVMGVGLSGGLIVAPMGASLNEMLQSGALVNLSASWGMISGTIGGSTLSSGSIGLGQLGGGAVTSGTVVSGLSVTYSRGVVDEARLAGQPISGIRAVALGSGGQFVVLADCQSGLRLPAIGVSFTNAVSGASLSVMLLGFVPVPASGSLASGNRGGLYVGSGGLLVNLSGFMGGASSGPGVGAVSGSYVQQVGFAVSGGIYVQPSDVMMRATVSGTYLSYRSGARDSYMSGFGVQA